MIFRNPTNGSIGIAIHIIIQLAFAKKQPKKFLGWGSVGLVFKKVLFFPLAETHLDGSSYNSWIFSCSRNILQGIGVKRHE